MSVSMPPAWSVWRQDDNGQRFLVATVESAREAEDLLNRYELAGHKQYYWIESLSNPE